VISQQGSDKISFKKWQQKPLKTKNEPHIFKYFNLLVWVELKKNLFKKSLNKFNP